MKEILIQQPQREVGKVTRVLGGSISDEVCFVPDSWMIGILIVQDASVRKTLLSFFGWYILALDKVRYYPFKHNSETKLIGFRLVSRPIFRFFSFKPRLRYHTFSPRSA